MLLKVFNHLKSQLSEALGADVKLIDWFNDQYSGTIHATPAVFVEFVGQLKFETTAKQYQQSAFTVRVHLASTGIMKQDNTIDSDIVQAHFDITEKIYFALQGLRVIDAGKMVFNSLGRTTFEHHQYMQGWMITTQDFEGMIYQHEKQKQKLETAPEPEITIE